MKEITLTNTTFKVQVDDSDFDQLVGFSWYEADGYATTSIHGVHKRMHTMIIPGSTNMLHVDHKDSNKLNNQRYNLRLGSRSYNQQGTRKFGTSKFCGVCWIKRAQRWEANITKAGNKIYIGRFRTEIEAALAYNKKAVEIYGDTVRLNNVH